MLAPPHSRLRLSEPVVSRLGVILPRESASPIRMPSSASRAFAIRLLRSVHPADLAQNRAKWADTGDHSIPILDRHSAVGAAISAHGWVHVLGGDTFPYVGVLRQMDPALRTRLSEFMADGNTAQSYTDQYCILHEDKYDERFTPARAALDSGSGVYA